MVKVNAAHETHNTSLVVWKNVVLDDAFTSAHSRQSRKERRREPDSVGRLGLLDCAARKSASKGIFADTAGVLLTFVVHTISLVVGSAHSGPAAMNVSNQRQNSQELGE